MIFGDMHKTYEAIIKFWFQPRMYNIHVHSLGLFCHFSVPRSFLQYHFHPNIVSFGGLNHVASKLQNSFFGVQHMPSSLLKYEADELMSSCCLSQVSKLSMTVCTVVIEHANFNLWHPCNLLFAMNHCFHRVEMFGWGKVLIRSEVDVSTYKNEEQTISKWKLI